MEFWEVDHVCQFTYEQKTIDIYVQGNPVACQQGLGWTPIYEVTDAWVKIDGLVSPTTARYDWGGGHHNDVIGVAIDLDILVIWHSSIGLGFRACAPPDCLLNCAAGATLETCDQYGGYVVDGCERVDSGPPLQPAICVGVNADGSVPPLLDPWTVHPGHDEYPLLPCLGDE